MPLTTTFPPPSGPNAKPLEPLSSDLEEKRLKILEHFSSDNYHIPGREKEGELDEQERFWLSDECFIRYLTASKWDVNTAIQRLEDTLKWRREFGVYNITAELVEAEAITGKEVIFGYDVDGRPALYFFPSRQNTNEQVRQLQYTVWMLERCVDLMGPGVGSLSLLIDFADRAKYPSFGTSKKFLNILQNHFPERLGQALIINVPFLVMGFLNLIMPFVDPATRAKMKFNPKVVEEGIMAPDQVMKLWGGNLEFEYKHDDYWKELVRLSETRRQTWFHRWRALGGTVGIREWEYKQEGEENQQTHST